MNARSIRFLLGAMVAVSLVGCTSTEPEPTSPPAATAETKPATGSEGGATPDTATASEPTPPVETPTASTEGPKLKGPQIVVSLDNGKSFTLQLDSEATPKSAAGIADLVKKKFYDGTRVHRVEPGFCVQWGDPYSKNGVSDPRVGTGGSGSPLPFEAGRLKFVKGTLGVASKGAGTGGDGQIFVMLGDSPSLDGGYASIGKVTKGLDVVENIQVGDKVVSMKIEG